MPIEVAIWRIDERNQPGRVAFSAMESENRLEQLIEFDLGIIDPGLLLIGRQVSTPSGALDLLAIDGAGGLVVLELKRAKTPREVVAQILDYGSWVIEQTEEDIERIYLRFQDRARLEIPKPSFARAFMDKFGLTEMPTLNQSHTLLVVASELDPSTERIINYLAGHHGVPVNAVFFRFFSDADREYLTRAWLADPQVVEERVERKRGKLPWDGEFYVTFGIENPNRNWEEARQYGFISAGGGADYSGQLFMLEPEKLAWVYLPKTGYAGLARILEGPVPVDDFLVEDGKGARIPLVALPVRAANFGRYKDEPELAEYLVRVEWIKAVPREEAVKEPGFFSNQSIAARPRVDSWRFTRDRLRERWNIPR